MKINASHFIYEDNSLYIKYSSIPVVQRLFNIYDLEEKILNDSLLNVITYQWGDWDRNTLAILSKDLQVIIPYLLSFLFPEIALSIYTIIDTMKSQ